MKFSPALKVGILTLVSVMILVFSVMWIKGRSLTSGNRISVVFNDVDGMRTGSGVQVMGLRVGQVEEITPFISSDVSYVTVKFVITEPGVEIPDGSTISIQQSGIIGEKFIEVTPPKLQYAYIPLKTYKKEIDLRKDDKVDIYTFNEKGNSLVEAGKVKAVEVVDKHSLPLELREAYQVPYLVKIAYVITASGLEKPEVFSPKVVYKNGERHLELNSKTERVYYVASDSPYTIIEPVRIREFLDLQLQAAKALNETNNKINAVLSDDVILDIKDALRNVKTISFKTSNLIDKTTLLVDSSKADIESLLKMANQLSAELALLANNLNTIAGDPEFQKSVVSMTKSLDKSSKQISQILGDEKTQETFLYLNETMKNLSEISASVNELTKDEDMKKKVNQTVDNLNRSMTVLADVLDKVDKLSPADKAKLSGIVNDAADTSKNLKKFSEKLNKRFLLFRLMF